MCYRYCSNEKFKINGEMIKILNANIALVKYT